MRLRTLCLLLAVLAFPAAATAELKMPSLFTDHMVLQRDQPIRVWGWTTPGTDVKVLLAGQSTTVTAADDGRFDAELPPLAAGGPHEMVIDADQSRTIKDILVGEVWICSGQSNMAWPVASADDPDLESLAADYPNIRLISVPQVGTQERQKDFDGQWDLCTPESVKNFSAVGYFFGRRLHQILDVPVGLIDNAWGGSAAEAWVDRDQLQASGSFDQLLDRWEKVESNYDYDSQLAQWENRRAAWVEGGREGRAPRKPRNQLTGNHRPGNIYNGVLSPTIGYPIRGVIWYQGESNSSRAYQYRELFPFMIQSWRDEWDQGDFPFYWVQLADYMQETEAPGESAWAELREAQTMTMDKLPNTGQAVIIDLGEASDIHPRNKQDVAKRLLRWALAKDYGYDVPYQSPTYSGEMKARGDRVTLTFDHVGGGLDTFDVQDVIGFTIAGDDQEFVEAEARLVPGTDNQIEVWSDEVQSPVAVRYAWADNPVCNVQSAEGLPLTPFRTDDFEGVTMGEE